MEQAPQYLPSPSDTELVRRCVAGERRAQMEVFHAHKKRVHGLLFRILGNNSEMEDLVQEAFLEVFRSLDSFRGEAQLSTWIARIATRVALAHIRRRKPRAITMDDSYVSSTHESPEVLDARVAIRDLYSALEKLDPKHRIAFALHVIDGRPMKDVAELTESTLVATKSHVWRARREVERRAKHSPHLAAYLTSQETSNDPA